MFAKKIAIPALVFFACLAMGIVDAIIQPGYVAKSIIKLILFLLIPILYGLSNKDRMMLKVFKPDKKGFLLAFVLGIAVYGVVLGAYFTFRNVFDFSALTASLNETTGVNKTNFLWVAIYISFINSLLEEFFFRGFAFLTLKEVASRKFAYLLSSLAFALYHIAMMIGWFGIPVVLIALAGLFVGGILFNAFNEKSKNIYLSWLVHMFANFAINTVGFILFAA